MSHSLLHFVTSREVKALVQNFNASFLSTIANERAALWTHCDAVFTEHNYPRESSTEFFLARAEDVHCVRSGQECLQLLTLARTRFVSWQAERAVECKRIKDDNDDDDNDGDDDDDVLAEAESVRLMMQFKRSCDLRILLLTIGESIVNGGSEEEHAENPDAMAQGSRDLIAIFPSLLRKTRCLLNLIVAQDKDTDRDRIDKDTTDKDRIDKDKGVCRASDSDELPFPLVITKDAQHFIRRVVGQLLASDRIADATALCAEEVKFDSTDLMIAVAADHVATATTATMNDAVISVLALSRAREVAATTLLPPRLLSLLTRRFPSADLRHPGPLLEMLAAVCIDQAAARRIERARNLWRIATALEMSYLSVTTEEPYSLFAWMLRCVFFGDIFLFI